jgi:hypothetical protein
MCRELETIQDITSARLAPAQGDYTNRKLQ